MRGSGRRGNRFRYRVPYLAIPAGELQAKAGHGLLTIDGANLFSVPTRDCGDGRMAPMAWFKVLGLIHYQAARLFLKGVLSKARRAGVVRVALTPIFNTLFRGQFTGR
jgi:hypothetical protein